MNPLCGIHASTSTARAVSGEEVLAYQLKTANQRIEDYVRLMAKKDIELMELRVARTNYEELWNNEAKGYRRLLQEHELLLNANSKLVERNDRQAKTIDELRDQVEELAGEIDVLEAGRGLAEELAVDTRDWKELDKQAAAHAEEVMALRLELEEVKRNKSFAPEAFFGELSEAATNLRNSVSAFQFVASKLKRNVVPF